MAEPFIDKLPERYNTQLGKWFKGGRELSGGQWQKIALARAFMRTDADLFRITSYNVCYTKLLRL